MLWLRTFQLGIKSLLLHPMRSLLTMLGILIGVFSVITLLAIGDGISKQAQKQIEDLGAENIMIRSIKPPATTAGGTQQIEMFGITRAERELLLNTIPTVNKAIPIREIPLKFSYSGNPRVRPIDGRLVGCTPEYREINRLTVEHGQFISPRHIETRANVCVIAGRLAGLLFPSEDPIGRELFLPEKRQYYRVIGVLEHREASAAIGGAMSGQDFSLDVYIPITTMRARMGDMEIRRSGASTSAEHFELSQVTLQVSNLERIEQTAQVIENTLRHRNPRRQDFSIIVPYELIKRAEETRQVFLIFLAVIAGISLLVGGIGIMNIMLATVTERTREIGIRRALGAKKSDIIRQFLVETVVLSVAGGLVGIVLGLSATLLVVPIKDVMSAWSPGFFAGLPPEIRDMKPSVVWMSVPLSFGISALVGVIFGIYPAMRAADMDPIEALRHE